MQNQDPGFNNGYSAGGTLQNQNLDFNNGYSAAPTTNSSANAPAANPWSQVGEPPSAPERAEDMSQAQRIAEACNCNQKIKKLYGSLKEADRLIGLLINDVVGIYKLLALRGIGFVISAVPTVWPTALLIRTYILQNIAKRTTHVEGQTAKLKRLSISMPTSTRLLMW